MQCEELEDRLERMLEGTLPAAVQAACEAHLMGCASCRELWTLASTPMQAADGTSMPPDDLLAAVLEQTSGSPCGRALELVSATLEETPELLDGELLELHLQGCRNCRALAAAMRQLQTDLPRLAELRPPAGFVDQVLASTLPLSVRWRRWRAQGWPRVWQRPRFAMEAAFVATLLVLPVLAPGSPLEEIPSRALAIAQTTHPLARLEGPMDAVETCLDSTLEAARSSRWVRQATQAPERIDSFADRCREGIRSVETELGTFRSALASLLTENETDTPSTASQADNTDQE